MCPRNATKECYQGMLAIPRNATLQNQVGCVNHRVVALVADKLERQWPVEVCFDVED